MSIDWQLTDLATGEVHTGTTDPSDVKTFHLRKKEYFLYEDHGLEFQGKRGRCYEFLMTSASASSDNAWSIKFGEQVYFSQRVLGIDADVTSTSDPHQICVTTATLYERN